MMVKATENEEPLFPIRQWLPVALTGLVYLVIGAVMISTAPGSQVTLEIALARPETFGEYLFQRHWLAIEIISLLLLVALVGALYLGRKKGKADT